MNGTVWKEEGGVKFISIYILWILILPSGAKRDASSEWDLTFHLQSVKQNVLL